MGCPGGLVMDAGSVGTHPFAKSAKGWAIQRIHSEPTQTLVVVQFGLRFGPVGREILRYA